MANRTMQAKALKLKRQRRLFPKNYAADYIPCGAGPDKFLMREHKLRTKSLAFDDAYMKRLEERQRFKGVPAGRYEVLKRLKMLEETFGADYHFVNLRNDNQQLVQLFYNSERTAFAIVETDFENLVVRMSMKYMDKERCIATWKSNKLRWVQADPLK